MELSSRPPGGSFEKDQGKWQGAGKEGGAAKTDTNKAREEIVAFCPGEGGAGRFRTETGQQDLTVQSCQNCIHYICKEDGSEERIENCVCLMFTEKG